MTIELKDIHQELTDLADEFGLDKPKDFEYYLNNNVEDFELMETLIDEDYQMISINNIEQSESEFDMDNLLEEESELIF